MMQAKNVISFCVYQTHIGPTHVLGHTVNGQSILPPGQGMTSQPQWVSLTQYKAIFK